MPHETLLCRDTSNSWTNATSVILWKVDTQHAFHKKFYVLLMVDTTNVDVKQLDGLETKILIIIIE